MIIIYGLIMVFGVVMLVFVGFVNYMVLLMIGVSDMVLLWFNNWSFWIFFFVFSLLIMVII